MKGDMNMKSLLMNGFYDGMTVAETLEFLERVYQVKPTEKQVSKAKNQIKEMTGKEWK